MKRFAVVLAALVGISCGNSRGTSPDTPGVAVETSDKLRDDFEKDNPKWNFVAGAWAPRASGGSRVLAQTTATNPWAVAILEERKFADVDVSVRFRPVSGSEDASGGVIFRAADGKNYFLVRANALEGNFRLYTMVDGRRSQLESADVEAPRLGEWHTIRVVARGDHIQAYLDGKLRLDHTDGTFKTGFVGLWTKADSVTEFDDLEVGGTSPK